MSRYAVLTLIGVLASSPALAAPGAACGDMIASLSAYLDAHPERAGTLPQTKDAQLMHQPTRQSVAKAKMESHDNLVALLAKAKSEQAGGDEKGCRHTLGYVEWMLKL